MASRDFLVLTLRRAGRGLVTMVLLSRVTCVGHQLFKGKLAQKFM